MVERIVYFGPFNNEKKKELIDKSIDYLKENKGNKFYYLLPNGGLLREYRRNFINEVESTFEVNIFTFDDIVNKVLQDSMSREISNPMKDLIVKDILKDLSEEGKINYFKDLISLKGFIKSCNEIIGEIKRSLVSPKKYNENCPNIPSFKEIGLIYSEYENRLEQLNLNDREGDYLKSIEILRKDNSFLQDLDFIIIDEFYDFRPIEIAILRELSYRDINIYINIPFKMDKDNPIINNTLEKLKELGFQVENTFKAKDNLFEEISSSLFQGTNNEFQISNEIVLIQAPSTYLEFKRTFEEIKKLNLSGVDLMDMAIVLSNKDSLEPLIKVAKEEQIPINMTNTIELIDTSLVRDFLNIIENINTGGSKLTVLNRVKSMNFPIVEKENREILEFILRKQNFSNITSLKNIVENEKQLNFSMENMEILKNAILKIEEEIYDIPRTTSVEEYSILLLEILDRFKLEEKSFDRYKITKDYKLFNRELKVQEGFKELLINMNELSLIKENISLDEYYLSLLDYLEEKTIIEDHSDLRGVKIFDPINTRGFKNKYLFMTGLSQGNYPNIKTNNFFLKDDNEKHFKSMGIEFKNYEDKMINESLKFASTISTCTEKLYLTYSGSGQESFSLPSMFLDEMFSLLKGESIEEKLKIISLDLSSIIKDDINSITNNKDLSNYLLNKYFNDTDLDENYFKIHNQLFKDKFLNINKKLKSEMNRYNNQLDKYSGLLDDEKIIKDIEDNIGNRPYSISYLESYSKCPFFFLLNNHFNIEEMERKLEEYSPIDIGSIYHQVLRSFYLQYRKKIEDHIVKDVKFPWDEALNTLKTLVKENFTSYGYDLNLNRDLIIAENTYDKLATFIQSDLERLNDKEKFLPFDFEVEFGKKSKFEIKVDGEVISMTGIIDRIDKVIGEEKYTIIDYKSSTYGLRNLDHMKTGLSLQLPVYIMSNEDRNVIAALYGIINSPKFDIPLGILDETKIISKRNKGGLNREEWDELLEISKRNILNITKSIKSGVFTVDPLECSPYCIYKDICRYEKKMEVE